MKLARICMAFVVTLMFASICAAQCGPAKGKTAGGSMEEMIIAQERMVLDAIRKRDANAFKSLVDVNGTIIGSQGPRKMSEIIPDLFNAELTVADFGLEDPHVMMLNKDTAILTYRSPATMTYKGTTASMTSYDTSVYVKRAGKWIAVFHQATDMPKTGAPAMTGEK